jgi:hypothetical protein
MIRSADLIAFHDKGGSTPSSPLWDAVTANHRHNGQLWEQEDLARRKLAPDAEIAGNKRAIDLHNQKRNDAIERIDEELLKALADPAAGARLNSETAGAMIDRLSILSLKIHHMRLQTQRSDVDPVHVESCTVKLKRFIEQRADLAACLDQLLAEAQQGRSYFKVYRQFKMYNDPKLNPAVYGETKDAKRS